MRESVQSPVQPAIFRSPRPHAIAPSRRFTVGDLRKMDRTAYLAVAEVAHILNVKEDTVRRQYRDKKSWPPPLVVRLGNERAISAGSTKRRWTMLRISIQAVLDLVDGRVLPR